MADFINTVDVLGDEALCNALIDKTITEYRDDTCTGIGQFAFYQCKNLAVVEVPNATHIGNNSFGGNYALTSVVFPKVISSESYNFNDVKITMLDFHVLPHIPNNMISYAPNLTALILRKTDSICTLNNTNGVTANTSLYIYVPRALIEEYKVATNWSTFVSQFRVLEDYTVDGTVDGDLDESKI